MTTNNSFKLTKNTRIYVAGDKGLVGQGFIRRLLQDGYQNIITRSHNELDLTNTQLVNNFFNSTKPEVVIMAAGKVGGIVENKTYPADFINTNLAIQQAIFTSAHRHQAAKVIFLGSSCMYPRETKQPMPEAALLTGKPEPTSIAYAMAKLTGVYTCLAYNKQYGCQRFLPLIPNNIYGANDDFNLQSAHVLPALIRRFHEAKINQLSNVTLWGSGKPRREFIHIDDVVSACLFLLTQNQTLQLPINIGTSIDYSIAELAKCITEIVAYTGNITWDESKPDGAPRKLLDSGRLISLGWDPTISLEQGIELTYKWYVAQYDNVGHRIRLRSLTSSGLRRDKRLAQQ